MKFGLIIIVLTVLAFAGGFLIKKESNISAIIVPGEKEILLSETKEPDLINPVSLPALMAKEFDGRDLKLGQVQDDNSVYTRYHITYKSGVLTISGIMNIPKGNPPQGGWPVLFLNHGHIDTSVYTNGRGLRREQDYLVRRGFAVLHSDYRDHAQSDKDADTETNVRLGYVEDVINAVTAVKNSDIPSLSKEKFGMFGHSMGGGITQAVMVVKPDLVKAVVLYAPVSSDVTDSYRRWTLRNSSNAVKIKTAHGSPEDNPEFWKNISPRNFFDKVTAPVMIFHGTADESCEIDWSRKTRDLLVTAGKRVELVEYPGQPHEFGPTWDDFMKRTSEFFKNSLK